MTRNRRLLLVASWFPSAKTPVRGSFVAEQATALARRGYDVHVVSFDRDHLRLPLGWSVTRNDAGVVEHSLGATSPLHRLIGFYAPRLFAARLRSLIAELRPALVHAHAVRPGGVVAARALAGTGIPLVLTEHSGPLSAFWKTGHGYRQIGEAYAACRVRIAVSEALRRSVLHHFPASGDWTVIHNGIDLTRFQVAPAVDRRRALLFVGSLEPVKGVDMLLAALALLPPDIGLTIVGTGPLEPALRAQAEALRLSARISWLGSRSRDEVAALMRGHAALAVTSLSETFSLVAAEALASGTPVIATRCGGPEEVVPSFGGILVPVGDAAAMAQAAAEIFSRRFAYDPVALNCYVRENFSNEGAIEKLELVYEHLVQ